MKTVSDLAYGHSGATNYVYVLENGKYTPFLVLTDDYGGNTMLLRRDVINENRRMSEYSSYYADSEIDVYLNEEYCRSLTEITEYIPTSKIEITCDDALGTSGSETETIDRKVFLLSCNEVGISDSVNIAAEGEMLEYFKDEDNRLAHLNEEPSSWWLRTPNTYYLSCTYVIGDNNKIGYTNAYDLNGIRPAFCIAGDTPIELADGIADDNMAYVFSLESLD